MRLSILEPSLKIPVAVETGFLQLQPFTNDSFRFLFIVELTTLQVMPQRYKQIVGSRFHSNGEVEWLFVSGC
jgi:hypothetical protein